MLVLSRKSGESFFLGEDIEIIVLEVQNERIKIGISAPGQIRIVRKELKDTEKANLDAVNSPGLLGIKI